MRFFSGRESWAFRADAVEELCGAHAALIQQALRPDERVEYLVYSPLREAHAAPFGIRGGSGSHGLALTSARVIISRDTHRSQVQRTVREIAYDDILAIEIGEALTLGWIVFRFASRGGVASEAIYVQALGLDLFRSVVRRCRQHPGEGHPLLDAEADGWHRVLASAPAYLQGELLPLLVAGEQPVAVVHAPEEWREPAGRRGQPTVTAATLFAATPRGFIVVQSERPPAPGTLVFAVNATCVSRSSLRRVTVAPDAADPALATLRIDVGPQSLHHQLTFELSAAGAERLAPVLPLCLSADSGSAGHSRDESGNS